MSPMKMICGACVIAEFALAVYGEFVLHSPLVVIIGSAGVLLAGGKYALSE